MQYTCEVEAEKLQIAAPKLGLYTKKSRPLPKQTYRYCDQVLAFSANYLQKKQN